MGSARRRCTRLSIWRLPAKPDLWDLGMRHTSSAGATLKSRWRAVFALYEAALDLCLARLPANSRSIVCAVLETVTIV
jgi:hypothetical protein